MDHLLMGLLLVMILLAIYCPALPHAIRIYLRHRRRETLACPETESPVSVQIDAACAARTAIYGSPYLRVQDCSRWPRRMGCAQGCLAEAA